MYHDEYDPDIHGDEISPPARMGMALAITLAIVAAPILVWWLCS